MAESVEKPDNKRIKSKPTGGYKDRFWYPRFWDGMGMRSWGRLLVKNRFDITPSRLAMAGIISGLSVMNAGFWGMQELFYGKKIRETKIEKDPIFIIGHWRSGTTLLHELFILNEQLTFPDTYACFGAPHFLFTGAWMPKLVGWMMPKQRPMDNVRMGFDRPQEDEFALCNLGANSPYLTLAFPNRPPQNSEYLTMEGLDDEDLQQWKSIFHWFVQCLTVQSGGKQVVLKSPPHTARIKTFLEMYPNARFVHIVRDPNVLFASTVNLWKRLRRDEGFQIPGNEGLEEYVLEMFKQMYAAFDRDRELVPEGRITEVRYEDLVQDQVGQMGRIYEEIGLDSFEEHRPALETFVESQKGYKTNNYDIDPEVKKMVREHWGFYQDRYGYAADY
jgi:omega-hydroxy-beta-dihydromenaquinone-9 sulfotransferase